MFQPLYKKYKVIFPHKHYYKYKNPSQQSFCLTPHSQNLETMPDSKAFRTLQTIDNM